nr:hypothetical protein BaRGS_029232 [Batillaria attramentaria]
MRVIHVSVRVGFSSRRFELIQEIGGERPCDKPWNHFADGCSKSIEDGDYFTPACDRHDICYNCGHLYGYSRKACDDGFWNDMGRICSQTDWTLQKHFFVSSQMHRFNASVKTSARQAECSLEEQAAETFLPVLGSRQFQYITGITLTAHARRPKALQRHLSERLRAGSAAPIPEFNTVPFGPSTPGTGGLDWEDLRLRAGL